MLKECGEQIPVTNDMVIGIYGLIAAGLVIAEDVVVTVAEHLAPAELYINVTKDVLISVS